MAKKIIIGILVLGVALGVIQLFGGNVFGFISWCFDWITYSIDKLANVISGNDTAQKAFSTRPGDISGVTSALFWRF